MYQMSKPDESLKEMRLAARLAWNNWPDTPEARKAIYAHEERDPFSACAWDRVIKALTKKQL
jgi:hypothetical protein